MTELDTIRSSLLAPVHEAGRSFSGQLSPSQVSLTGTCVTSARTSVSYMKNDRWVEGLRWSTEVPRLMPADLVAEASSQVKWSTMTLYAGPNWLDARGLLHGVVFGP